MVATKPVDFRKGAEGLAALVRETMGADPFSGAVYVFRAKRTDRIKLIFWDGTGVCLYAKRLEEGGVPLAEDRGRGDPADGGATVGADRGARLAACPPGASAPRSCAGGIACGEVNQSPFLCRRQAANVLSSPRWQSRFLSMIAFSASPSPIL
jgi:transposase